ncbi:nibrin-like [Saccoglossus kowalevskii]|uniref:Nibrin-like n=1 Tax=Saccoglossus kowalevskii TaxID=10224 RepID=A0ABM0MA91_SACKO|nr:PREDICTED: nibrin-like [Saccoglossus kowalevskii]
MWLLKSTKNDGREFYILVGKEYVIGRKDCCILIQNDQSISRKHSVLSVTHSEANLSHVQRQATLTMKDCSKYGTFLNGCKVDSGSSNTLKHGDIIVFGSLKSNEWKVCYRPLIVCSSCLDSTEKKFVKSKLVKLGGHMVNEWTKDTTLLIMSKLNVTVKVITALILCHPIVTPQYLVNLIDAMEGKADMPTPKKFLPVLVDAAIKNDDVSFAADERRKQIFKNKTFIFLTQKQFKRLNLTVSFGGGKAILMEEGSDDDDDDILVTDNTCVMSADPQDSSQKLSQNAKDWISHVMDYLKNHNLRAIQDAELGLAVLHCSCQFHCNPNISQAGVNLLQPLPSQTLGTQEILAADTETSQVFTQHRTQNILSRSSFAIPSTSESQIASKRLRVKKERVSGNQESLNQRTTGVSSEGGTDISRLPETPESKGNKMKAGARKREREVDTGTADEVGVSSIKQEPLLYDLSEIQSSTSESNLQNLTAPRKITTMVEEEVVRQSPRKRARIAENQPTISETLQKAAVEEKLLRKSPRKVNKELVTISTPTKSWQIESHSKKRDDEICDGNTGTKTLLKQERNNHNEDAAATSKRKRLDISDDDDEGLWRKRPNIKQEVVQATSEDHLLNDNQRQPFTGDIPQGFITTLKSIKGQFLVKTNTEYQREEDQPSKLIELEEKSLVVRRPRPQNKTPVEGDKGVKNFKKFRKCGYPGMTQSLPRIIGGTDLVAHSNKPEREVEEWFKGQVQVDSQQDKSDNVADDLFNWQPKGKKARKR